MCSPPTPRLDGDVRSPGRPRSRFWPEQTQEEIQASTAAIVAQIKARETERETRREILRMARAQARASVKVRQTRLSEAGLAAIIAGGPPNTLRQTAARRRLRHLRSAAADHILGWRDIKDVAPILGMSRERLGRILSRDGGSMTVGQAARLAQLLEVPIGEVVQALLSGEREQDQVQCVRR